MKGNMKLKQLALSATAAAFLVGGNVSLALAQVGLPAPAPISMNVSTQDAGFRINDISRLLTQLLNMVLLLAALLVFAYLVWGGVQWITSGGDKGKTEEARNKITAAIIGLAVLAASYAIFRLVISFLGIGNPFDSSFVIPQAWGS
jgi:hypothetical protein